MPWDGDRDRDSKELGFWRILQLVDSRTREHLLLLHLYAG